jgi:hypothetical protein
VRTACHAVFAARSSSDGRSWPPAIELPARWLGDYDATLRDYDLPLNAPEVPVAFFRFLIRCHRRSSDARL